ncbi:MAG: class I SAM-dependent methyltransferase [Chloroflexota bacterium]
MTNEINTSFTGLHDPNLIGAVGHQFHDAEYVQGWADRFAPNPSRVQLFNAMVERIEAQPLPPGYSNHHIVELGVGPGYLALEILSRLTNVTYEGVDFSAPMIEIARARLNDYSDRVAFTRVDLTSQGWGAELESQPSVIVSTWALHDLGHPDHIQHVYSVAGQTLPSGGILMNGDFVKPAGAKVAYEPGRVLITEHLAMLDTAGFTDTECLISLEEDAENPTSANNYACAFGRIV